MGGREGSKKDKSCCPEAKRLMLRAKMRKTRVGKGSDSKKKWLARAEKEEKKGSK